MRPDLRLRFFLILCTGLGVFLYSCARTEDLGEEELARYGTSVLKRKDLLRFLPAGFASPEDSLSQTRQFIDTWLMEQVLTDQALGEIDGLEGKIEYKVKDYRNRLILSEYYDYLIQTRLDTVIDSLAFNEYYRKHIDKYNTQEPLYQFIYLGTNVLDIRKPLQLLNTNIERIDYALLSNWAGSNAFVAEMDTTAWYTASDLEGISTGSGMKLVNVRPGNYAVVWNGTQGEKPAQYIFKMIRTIPAGVVLPESMVQESVKQGVIQDRTRRMIEAEKIRLLREAEAKGNVYVQ